MTLTHNVKVDWNDDGDFDDTGETVTSRVLARTPVTIQYGRDQSRSLSPVSVGQAAFELDNRSRDYYPDNSSSPLFGNTLPGRTARIGVTESSTPITDATLFRGFIEGYDLFPDIDNRSVQFTLVDGLAKLREATITTGLFEAVKTGSAISSILDAAGWPADARDLDVGATTIPWFWAEGEDAFTAIQQVVNSEGPGAIFYVDGNGNLVFKDRHHRILDSASITSQATFRDAGAEPLFSAPLGYDVGWRDIVNDVTLEISERSRDNNRSVVWNTEDIITLAGGELLRFVAVASDPFNGAVTPAEGTDYTLLSGSVTPGLGRTSGQSTYIYLQAGPSGATVQGLSLRAFSVPVRRTISVTAQDTFSIDRYGVRSYQETLPWANVNHARAIAEVIVAQRSDRLPIVNIRIVASNDTRAVQAVSRTLSDRITVVDSETGLNTDFFIENIQHAVSEAGLYHETVFGCEKAPAQAADVFILDSGQLDVNRLGNAGLDSPTKVFVFDHATQGKFGTGVLGH